MKVLVLGATGQLGSLLCEELKVRNVPFRVTGRKREQLISLKEKYGDAVFLDLDDPTTFGPALEGVDALFLLTSYSVNMLVQSKAMIDAAKKAGVKHVVHLGVFSADPDCYDAHFAWHQMIEAYIKEKGIAYTFLHPNCFLQNFTGFYGMVNDGYVRFYALDKPVGWIALEDVAVAAATIFKEGVSKHGGKEYWFSTESLNVQQIAKIFSEVTGVPFVADGLSPDQFIPNMGVDRRMLDPYFFGVEESFKQIVDGRMGYIADVKDDMPKLVGRKGLGVKEWATFHKEEIAAKGKKT